MFSITQASEGHVIIAGRLDAANAEKAQAFLDGIGAGCELDMQQLEYISSAGLGVLLKTHKRLMADGQGLVLVNVSKHINDIFKYSGFDNLFEIRLSAE